MSIQTRPFITKILNELCDSGELSIAGLRDPAEIRARLLDNQMRRLYQENKELLDRDEEEEMEPEDFKPTLQHLLERVVSISEMAEDPETHVKFTPADRLENLVAIDKMFEGLAEVNSDTDDFPFSDIIADHKIRVDAVRAELEEKLAKTDPNSELLEQSKHNRQSIFNKPGSPEANELKRAMELQNCGDADEMHLLRASWNYLRLKDTTPWTDFGKRRAAAAAETMAREAVNIISSDVMEEGDRTEAYHAAQLECMRSHEFRKQVLENVKFLMSDDIPNVKKETLALYVLACEAERVCPGKNGPASGKMPEGSPREKAAEETLARVQAAMEKKFGKGLEDLTVERLKSPEKEGEPNLMDKLERDAFPAPKEPKEKSEPQSERTSSVSQL